MQLQDLQTGDARRFDDGPQMLVEAHLWEPKPGGTQERDCWLLGTGLDTHRQVTVLNLLDAAHIEVGPVAQAERPSTLPPGLHGNFQAV